MHACALPAPACADTPHAHAHNKDPEHEHEHKRTPTDACAHTPPPIHSPLASQAIVSEPTIE